MSALEERMHVRNDIPLLRYSYLLERESDLVTLWYILQKVLQ